MLIPALMGADGGVTTGPATQGAPATAPYEVWISPDGSDSAAGTREEPLASLSLAVRKVRDLRRQGSPAVAKGGVIRLRGGRYFLDTPVVIRQEDAGGSEDPLAIEGAPGERVVLSGGMPIKGWRRLEKAIPGLPPEAVGKVWAAAIPEFHGRPLRFRQLWVNDQKAVRARTPNGDVCERLTAWDPQAREAGVSAAVGAQLEHAAGAEMVVQQQWEIANLRIAGVRKQGDGARVRFYEPEGKLEFEHPWPQPILPPQGGGAYFLANAAAFLDSPGEWYADTTSGQVLYWPRDGEDLATAEVIVPAAETLLEVAGSVDRPAAHVVFRNLTFAHATWLRPSEQGHVPLQAGMPLTEAYKLRPKGTPEWRSLDNQAWIDRMPAAVKVRDAHHITFERCHFAHTAAAAIDFVTGTSYSLVQGCTFRDIGGNGLQMGSFQEGATETHLPYDPRDERVICQQERIANNYFNDIANEDWGCLAIAVGYARHVTIEHNDITNCSYSGISLGWGWTRARNALSNNLVRANRITRIATRMCDTAGVYTLSNQPGTVVTENMVDDITMSPYVDRPDHWFYLYTDEGTSHVTVSNNWTPSEKFLRNANGPGNTWQNNGPMVSSEIKDAAGLEPAYRDLRTP
jgi:hypothetical protein